MREIKAGSEMALPLFIQQNKIDPISRKFRKTQISGSSLVYANNAVLPGCLPAMICQG
jgi:hypothetical protein